MIAKEEYIAAMAIVEAYQEQLKAAASMGWNYTEPTILDFIEHVDISTRLRNVLSGIVNRDIGRPIRLEDIKEYDLGLIPNIGQVSVKEFVEKRNEYLRERQSFSSLPENSIRSSF